VSQAVVGVFSLLIGTCGDPLARNVHTQLASFEAEMREAFDAAGAEPVVSDEGPPNDESKGSSAGGCSAAPVGVWSSMAGVTNFGLWGSLGLAVLAVRRRRSIT
jgi:hypothetical protein